MSDASALILVNLGTPASPTAQGVRDFLRPFLSDRRVVDLPRWFWLPILYGIILPFRSPKVARLYQKIWWPEGSPLEVITQRQAQKLAQHFQGSSERVEVRYAMVYGNPSLSSVVGGLAAKGIHRVLVLPLYPQFCSATTGSVCDQMEHLRRHYGSTLSLKMIKSYHDDPRYIQALASSITRFWQKQGKAEKLLFSFHGIPQALIDRGDPYFHHCHETAEQVAQALGLAATDWQVSFQSRFGKAEWAKPYTDVVLQSLTQEAVKSVDVVTPAFAADCLETLEEIAQQNAELFVAHGGQQLRLIPCLNDQPEHIEMMAAVFEQNKKSLAFS